MRGLRTSRTSARSWDYEHRQRLMAHGTASSRVVHGLDAFAETSGGAEACKENAWNPTRSSPCSVAAELLRDELCPFDTIGIRIGLHVPFGEDQSDMRNFEYDSSVALRYCTRSWNVVLSLVNDPSFSR